MYRLALESCEPVADRQLPSAEIVPVVFLQWSQLTEEEKGVLLEAVSLLLHEDPVSNGRMVHLATEIPRFIEK